ncbi:MAG: hypothetical protein MZW92_40125 [Comamonadaceae bacterium]|nr:hypothetical protein [Comamonadaceae bacterium]
MLYFAGYKKMIDRYKVEDIEAAADVVVWCCDEGPGFAPGPSAGPRVRRQHRAGDDVPTRAASSASASIPFADADRIIAIGSDRMMAAVARGAAQRARAVPEAGPRGDRLDQLADAVHDEGDLRAVPAAARRPGDRQAQLRVHAASTRTSRSTVVDFAGLDARLRQNSVQEKLNAQWLARARRAADAT